MRIRLFAGSDAGGERAAEIYIGSAKRNGLDPETEPVEVADATQTTAPVLAGTRCFIR